ncbi:MAG: hypothetical protein HY329_04085 [Chloroflexi bacterium]|nr:hypothetical protein [Chloroflexota bacterium]
MALLSFGVLASLVLNLVVIQMAYAQRRALDKALEGAVAEVRKLQAETISYDVRLDQNVPVFVTVPIKKTFNTRITTSVPVNTSVTIPVTVLGQTWPINVPIQANVPIDAEVPVNVDEEITINSNVPAKLDIPVRFKVSETPLASYLKKLEEALSSLRSG